MKNYTIKINGKKVGSITADNAELALRAYAATKPNSAYGFIRKIKMIDADTHGDTWAIAITDGGEITAERGDKTQTTTLIISSGQYETAAIKIDVKHSTDRGLIRRARQLAKEHAVYGDNHAGWINADIAIASDRDKWGNNDIIGGRWCSPANDWLDLSDIQ